MDIVVAHIPPKFGMLLSRSWEAKLKGSIQMDMSYATIHVFGVHRQIFREPKLAYMVTSTERPHNHPIYSLDTVMGYVIFFTEGGQDNFSSQNYPFVPTQEELERVWNVIFYGEASREGAGTRV